MDGVVSVGNILFPWTFSPSAYVNGRENSIYRTPRSLGARGWPNADMATMSGGAENLTLRRCSEFAQFSG